MSFKQFFGRLLLVALVVFAAGQLFHSTSAEAGWGGKCLNQTGCSICCPACDHVCRLDVEQAEEEIPCFEVESKVICIPRVVFPWQKKKCRSCAACDGRGCTNCVHNGARTRRICVLKTDNYKCPKCKYTWTAEKKPCCGCNGGCDACCDSPCAAIGRETAVPTVSQLNPAPVYRDANSAGLQTVDVK